MTYWSCAKRSVATVHKYIEKVASIDKVRVALLITWIWAVSGLYVTKVFEAFFKSMLSMPEAVLPNVQTSPKNIQILAASDGTRDITKKFKLFLKYYWDSDESDAGFSFSSLQRLLNCSMLYCSYLLTDSSGNVDPEKFWQSVNGFLVTTNEDKVIKYNTAGEPRVLPFGTVKFHEEQKTQGQPSDNLLELIKQFENK